MCIVEFLGSNNILLKIIYITIQSCENPKIHFKIGFTFYSTFIEIRAMKLFTMSILSAIYKFIMSQNL